MSIPPIYFIAWPASLVLLGFCAGTDLKHRRIPNELVASIAAIGLLQTLVTSPGEIWLSLLAMVAVFLGLGILSHHKFIGGGDVKLISAVTLLVPAERSGQLLLEIALAGGVLSCAYIAARYRLRTCSTAPFDVADLARPKNALARVFDTECERIAAGSPMPYAFAIFGGACIYAGREFVSCLYAIFCSL
jgi:prepilin peptidase CpaA